MKAAMSGDSEGIHKWNGLLQEAISSLPPPPPLPPLLVAAQEGHVDEVELLLKDSNIDVNECTKTKGGRRFNLFLGSDLVLFRNVRPLLCLYA
jgi:hypothetical protein